VGAAVTTTLFLIRHASHPLLGRILVGRTPNVSLGPEGLDQARRVGRRFAGQPIRAVQSSPQPRARETAAPIAEGVNIPVEIASEVDEVDVGEWAGREFETLNADPRWELWNRERSSARAPGGESMLEVQDRVVAHIDRVRSSHPGGKVVIVSHADVIRAAVLYYLGLPLNAFDRIEISPASVSTLLIGDWGAKIFSLNETVAA
jgi:broad specificity phosphatase PhoE